MIWILRPSVSEERADAGDWLVARRALGGPGRTFALSVSTERLLAPEGARIHLMVLAGSARHVQGRRYCGPPWGDRHRNHS
jgi:hypothetical protein